MDEEGNPVHLEPLLETMRYQYEERQTLVENGSHVLQLDQLNAELFYPQQVETAKTTEIVQCMTCEVAEYILKE